MKVSAVEAFCLSRTAATVERPFGPNLQTFKVGGKIFAMLGDDGGLCFKASEIAYELLREQGRAQRAPYLPRGGWLKIASPEDWEEEELSDLLQNSHHLVAKGLTRKQRQELGL
ncbi:MmcQ/YjbR family DNA-binding protein [uncultured Brevundimonas sp.]|uniref:MmcQ/YjbR family DNA-binding protein n=1 Tax=uncultured Brevundimonas sp. TaxID=213418 RepID=UPI0026041962|nr:MmcQ/YjbR family DNA-binding protein [uncultured Brevundimonas sp.]